MVTLHDRAQFTKRCVKRLGNSRVAYDFMKPPMAMMEPEIGAGGMAAVIHHELAVQAGRLVVHALDETDVIRRDALERVRIKGPLAIVFGIQPERVPWVGHDPVDHTVREGEYSVAVFSRLRREQLSNMAAQRGRTVLHVLTGDAIQRGAPAGSQALLHAKGNGLRDVRQIRGQDRGQHELRIRDFSRNGLSPGGMENAEAAYLEVLVAAFQAMDPDLISPGRLESLHQVVFDVYVSDLVAGLGEQQSDQSLTGRTGTKGDNFPL